MASETISVLKEECYLDEIINELPNRVAKPVPTVKGNNLSFSKFLHQISDSLKDLSLVYTCLDVSSLNIALGTNVGNAFIYQRNQRKIVKISSETKYVPTTCIRLAAGCGVVAFGHECGTFSVGFVDPPVHTSFDSLTAKDIHHKEITCLEWSTDGLILYAGDSEGNISMSVVKISEAILQTAMIFKEEARITQLSYDSNALLVSTMKRTLIWSFQTEGKVQVGEKERKTTGLFGGVFIPDILQESSKRLYAVRPGQRIWTADDTGKVLSTSVFKPLLEKKPQTIYTLDCNNSKVNSGGQFGVLLNFYKKFVVTWDHGHLWVLDLENGAVVACHSNLGKICDVSVSGHELFVLLNQRERFLRRFILINEDIGPTSLDAIVAVPDGSWSNPLLLSTENEFEQSSNEAISPLSPLTPVTAFEPIAEDNVDSGEKNDVDMFQRINATSYNKGDIVFTAAKKKKKKKKVKQVSDTTKKEVDNASATDNKDDPLPSETVVNIDKLSTSLAEDTNIGAKSGSDGMNQESDGDKLKAGLLILNEPGSASELDQSVTQATETNSCVLQQGTSNIDTSQVTGNTKGRATNANDEELGLPTPVIPVLSAERKYALNIGEGEVKKLGNVDLDITKADIKSILPTDVGAASGSRGQVDKVPSKNPDTPCKLEDGSQRILEKRTQDLAKAPVEDKRTTTEGHVSPIKEPESGLYASGEESDILLSPGPDSLEFHDEIQLLEESSTYLRSDSYEAETSESLTQDTEKDNPEDKQNEDVHSPLFADTWSKRDLPTTYAITSIAISGNHVFCVDVRDKVYYSDPSTVSGKGWEQGDWKAKEVYVDDSCHLVAYRGKGKKAYVRGNVSRIPPVGDVSYVISEDVAALVSCAKCTWVLTLNGGLKKAETSTLLDLKSDLKNPRIWRQEDATDKLCQIACYHGVLWGRTSEETLHVHTGHSGGKKSWATVKEKKSKWLNMSNDGTLWIITPEDEIWFKPGISLDNPQGEVWYQVTLGQYIIDDASMLDSAFNFFYYVGSAYKNSRTTEYLRHAAKGLFQSTKDMACSLFRDGGNPKQICCNTKSGVWLLDTKNALHACRGQVTGSYWERVCPSGTAHSATWRQVSTGLGNFVWALQPNGELTCFNPNGPSYNVVGPSSRTSIDFITSSPHGVWCFASAQPDRVYIRDGISDSYPHGFEWVTLHLCRHEITSVKHVSVGRITVWALDHEGDVWVRIGQVCGDGPAVLSQAWVSIDKPENVMLERIEVDWNDTMVWATDNKGNVYARDGVSEAYLIGTSWREVAGTTLKSVRLSSSVVYGLCINGEIVCRFGVSPTNSGGDYWKKIPGNFAQISINEIGELWGISSEEQLFSRKTKCLFGGRMVGKEIGKDMVGVKEEVEERELVGGEGDSVGEDGDWEML